MLSFDKLTKSVDNKSGDLDLNSLNSDLSKVPTEFAMKDDASNLSPSPTNNGTCMFTFLRKVPILSDLNEKQLELLGVALKREKYENGDRIITQGEHGVKFFFLLNGHVVVNQRTFKGAKEVVRKVNEYCTGDYFGEGALLQDAPRMADVVAVENCTCLSLHRDDFHHILGDVQTEMETQFRARVLNGVDLLANLTDEERYEIAAALVVETFEDGESIITQGEMGNKFYMIKEGEVLFTRTESDDNMETAKDNPAKDNPAKDNPAKDNNTVAEETDNNNVDEKKPEGSPKQTKKKEPKEIGRFFAGQSFGEGSLLTEAPRRANALAVGKVTVLSLERDAFSRVFNESLQDMLNKDYNTRVVHSSGNMETMKFENLETLLLLGTGTYGKVFLVTHKVTGGTYALKCMEKSRIIKLEQQEHVKNEKRILTEIKHPFVVDLVQTFVGPNYVYALLEAVLGGELFSLMREAGRFKLKPALFYIAQLVLVLKHLHSHNIVYRDLKPENLMLSAKGYLKMTDFGLAKQLNVHAGETKTYTLCGTPCYAAPEIYNLSGHGPPVDWWALGVLTHEILSGITPFTGDAESIFATMYAYGRAYPNIKLPAGLNGHSGDFVLRLLHPNPNKRLGGRDCKAHKLLRKINWTRILQQEATAPYVPKIDSLYDTRNFYHRQDKNGADEILDEVMDDLAQSEPGKSWDL
eukprot:CAMPEP_0204864738 /NCGR_PEP_ID=MMETSP1348-20121228/4276_1 /ASSEMBLY_ACC=CAM_ASM_000700 /TAXON_ID=215587 /ORGANISM="Aplanochytrium stocchinoi, Strain GSBS06" /LENGTH=693 /DNA_ID=CAMNT_0052015455 /DNA_START=90 /DNA_END=2171 /DNA_ORIENTATION=+